MIISCPSCGARYKVRDDLIPDTGKRVKCKKCTSLFRAFPGKKAILEKATQAPPKRASSQATVMVDQSRLSNYLQQQEQKGQSNTALDPSEKKDEKKASHATVQIDRTKIDAFLQNKVDRAGGDYEPNTTLEVSREELDSFLQKSPKNQVPGGQSGEPATPPAVQTGADKFQDLQRALGAISDDQELHKATVEMPPPAALIDSAKPKDLYETPSSPPKISTESPDATPGTPGKKELDLTVPASFESPKPAEPSFPSHSSDDGFWTSPTKAPEFPTDEELGLTEEPESDLMGQDMPAHVSFDEANQNDDDDFFADRNDDPDQDDDFLAGDSDGDAQNQNDDFLAGDSDGVDPDQDNDFLSGSDDEITSDFSPQAISPPAEPTPDAAPPVAAGSPTSTEPVTLYTVKVEDTEYPNKSLDALDRWIHEGRLLETDLVALVGSSDFKKAYDIPEIRNIFDRYFGQSTSVDSHSESAKKGFFGKLFSIFGKKS